MPKHTSDLDIEVNAVVNLTCQAVSRSNIYSKNPTSSTGHEMVSAGMDLSLVPTGISAPHQLMTGESFVGVKSGWPRAWVGPRAYKLVYEVSIQSIFTVLVSRQERFLPE